MSAGIMDAATMELLNQQLQIFHPDARNFFVLFKHIDIDGSRRISFGELARLCREQLKLTKADLPEPRLLGARPRRALPPAPSLPRGLRRP